MVYGGHGMVYGLAWRACYGILNSLAGIAWYMVWPCGRAWYRVWPGGHRMVLLYGLVGLARDLLWPCGHRIVK